MARTQAEGGRPPATRSRAERERTADQAIEAALRGAEADGEFAGPARAGGW